MPDPRRYKGEPVRSSLVRIPAIELRKGDQAISLFGWRRVTRIRKTSATIKFKADGQGWSKVLDHDTLILTKRQEA